ncbi:MAG: DNRLRE domain-containing protein [Thermoplasmata archaeon]|nr:MAG: DNRLRE domain-containing protein [Thermoplasmata archaeon]
MVRRSLKFQIVCIIVLLMITSEVPLRVETVAAEPPLQLEHGEGNFTYEDDGGNIDKPVRVFYIYPETFDTTDDPRIVFVLHGYYRDAEKRVRGYRPYPHLYDALFLFPEFTTDDWPDSQHYHEGNVLADNGTMNPRADWSYSTILEIFYQVVASVPNPPDTFDIQGHSAGAYVAHRMAFLMDEAPFGHIVVANAGCYLLPTYDEPYPDGIADMDISTADLALAFSRDLTLTLGTLDNDPDAPLLSHTEWAEAQGPHRFARGHYFYNYCKNLAANLSLPFRWKLVEVEGVGHSPNAMAPSAIEAIFGSHSRNFTPLDDAHIKYNNNNYGDEPVIQVDADFGMRAFLKFDLTSLADVQIKFAALRLNVTDSSEGIQFVHFVPDNNWSEDTLTNDTKPDFAEQVSTGYGGIEYITTVMRLTEFVRTHQGDVVSLYMETNSSDGFYFSSKEAGHAPEILIWEVEEPPQTETFTLIQAGDGWSYSEVDPQPDPDWNVPLFNDSAWSSGPAPFGFGDPITYGTVLNDNDGSYYFRKTFYIDPGVEYENLTVYVASNNYAMVYLNGILVDDDSGANHEFEYWNRVVTIPGDYLLKGTNTIAAYVYNNVSSLNVFFDLRLDGEIIVNHRPTITLHPGWNLISLPCVQINADIDTVFSSISGSYNAIQCYDVLDAEDPWKHYHIDKPSHLNDLHEVHNDMGIWIHITDSEDVLFEVPGILPTEGQTVTLKPGWNLVGYPRLTNSTRTEGLNNTVFGTHINMIMRFDTTSGNWGNVAVDDIFEVGRGYWVHSLTSHVWKLKLD